MSISLLQHLTTQRLPLNVTDAKEAQELRLLSKEGLIAAFFLKMKRDARDAWVPGVRVLAITAAGRRQIDRLADPDARGGRRKSPRVRELR